jgi:copper chaperone
MNPQRIRITGMTCAHCVNAVTRALQAVPGVQSVQVSLAPAQATVSGTADRALLIKAIQDEGYRAVADAA